MPLFHESDHALHVSTYVYTNFTGYRSNVAYPNAKISICFIRYAILHQKDKQCNNQIKKVVYRNQSQAPTVTLAI